MQKIPSYYMETFLLFSGLPSNAKLLEKVETLEARVKELEGGAGKPEPEAKKE